MEYRLGSTGSAVASVATIPFSMKSSVELLENSANVDLVFQPSFGSSKGLQSVLIEWYLGKGVTTSNWIPGGGGGTCTYDSRSGLLQWQIPALSGSNSCTLRGTYSTTLVTPRPAPSLQVSFMQAEASFSSLKIQDLRVTSEQYKPFKGVRSQLCGKVDVRW